MRLPKKEKLRKMLRFTAVCFMAVLQQPVLAHAGVAAQTLTSVGLPLVQLLVLVFFGWTISYLANALGYGQIGNMMKVVTVFSCIGIVISTVWAAISKVATFFGITL